MLVQGVHDYAIYMLDANGCVSNWNAGAQAIKGYHADEIVGQHFSLFYTPEDREAGMPAKALATALRNGKFEGEAQRVRKNGERFWASVLIDPIHDDAGQLVGFAKVTRDITDRRRAEEELQKSREALLQAQKMEAIGRLTGGVAHDFNNLLTVIRASADFLRRPNLSEEKRARYIKAIADTAERATVLTGQLLAFSRRQTLQPEVFDVNTRLAGLRQMIGTSIGAFVEVSIEFDAQPQLVEVDPSQFETAILNMVINARDAMQDGGRITIRSGPAIGVPSVRGHSAVAGDFVAVQVVDSGTGMSAETMSQIFEPFFTTKPVDKGTGLGLSQVYGFAKQSSGDISVKSELGVGSTFTLFLPRSANPITPVAVRENDDTEIPRRHVLLVEDNEGVGRFAAELLDELGQSVTWVSNGRSALELLETSADRFDLVFSDVVMPGMSGIDLAREVTARWPRLQVVLTSGYSHVLAESGTYGYALLKKPYSVEGLLTMLRSSHLPDVRAP
jgi:PAS domain S-box-containing protein